MAGGVALQMERESDQGRRRWPAAMASTPRSLSPERIRTDPAATARESARGGRNRAPRHVRRRVPQPPCAAARGSAPLVLPAGRSPLAATPPHARGPPRRGRSAPPRRHGGERERAARRGHQRRPRNLCAGGGGGGRGDGAGERGRRERRRRQGVGAAAPRSGSRERRGRGRGARGEGSGDGTERADGLNHDSRSRVNIWSDSIFGFVRVFGYRPSKPDLPEIISGTVTYYPK